MKKTLHTLTLLVLLLPTFMQGEASAFNPISMETVLEDGNSAIKIFPNPATEYIELTENKEVIKIVVYNLAGREMKRFDAFNGEKYYVGDLARGLYLVQLLDKSNQTIVTQRVSKR
ncbi:MAG: T9SS type A sorting domain-containing protein [Saprospiraceae bacterium]|nr:T9SS type A sorting domain-containing protein [Saprospiraceae bacterium]